MAARNTIASLNYKLYLDSAGLAKGTKQAQADFRTLKKAEKETATETEKLQTEFDSLAASAEAGVPGALQVLERRLEQTGKKLNKHGKLVDTYGTKWKKVATGIKGAVFNIKTLGLAIAGSAIARSVGNQIEKFDELAKTARQLGTEVEYLSQMQFVAGQQIGFTADQTTKAFEKMTRRVGEATMGTGEALMILEKYGITVQQFSNKSPEEVFNLLGDAFRFVTNEQEQMVIGTKLFDDELAGMFQVMVNAREETSRLRQQAVDLGGALTSLDASQIEALSNSMGEFQQNWNKFSMTFMRTIGPALNDIVIELTSILDRLDPGKAGRPTGDRSTMQKVATPFLGIGRTAAEMMADPRGVMFGEHATAGGKFGTGYIERLIDNMDVISEEQHGRQRDLYLKFIKDQSEKQTDQNREMLRLTDQQAKFLFETMRFGQLR